MKLHFTTPEKSEEEKEQARRDEFMRTPIAIWVITIALLFIALALYQVPSPTIHQFLELMDKLGTSAVLNAIEEICNDEIGAKR